MQELCVWKLVIIIIINPLTARVIGVTQMILQPVFSIFPCSPLPSGTRQTPGLSIYTVSWNATLLRAPVGSPSRSGDVVVYVKDINQPSLPAPFYSVLVCLFMSLWPFQLYFIP